MNDNTAFKPFVPPEPMFEESAPPAADKPAKPKRERKPRAAAKPKRKPRPPAADKPKIPPAPKHVRPTRKKIVAKKKRAVGKAPALAGAYTSRPGLTYKSRAFKLDMYAAMAISALLKPADFKMFESLTETLQSVNKATRRRVLAAIGKVFG